MEWQLVVPGASDLRFWNELRRRGMLPQLKKVIDASGDPRMISDATLHDARAAKAGRRALFLRDLDEFPCVSKLLERFPSPIPAERRVIVVRRCLEAWFLADEVAINRVLPNAAWKAPAEADRIPDPNRTLAELFRRNTPLRTRDYKKTEFAPQVAAHFEIERAAARSASLRRLVQRIAE